MANFRAYPGLFVRILEDCKTLKKGQIVQILKIPSGLTGDTFTFVGVYGWFSKKELHEIIEPVYEDPKAPSS